jgi:hypothetical protein
VQGLLWAFRVGEKGGVVENNGNQSHLGSSLHLLGLPRADRASLQVQGIHFLAAKVAVGSHGGVDAAVQSHGVQAVDAGHRGLGTMVATYGAQEVAESVVHRVDPGTARVDYARGHNVQQGKEVSPCCVRSVEGCVCQGSRRG